MEYILLLLVVAAAMAASLQGCSGGGESLAEVQDGTGEWHLQSNDGSWECKSPTDCGEGSWKMSGSWGSEELNISTQPIAATGCWKIPKKPDGSDDLTKMAWAGVSNGFGTDSTFVWDTPGGSFSVCFANKASDFHGSIIANAAIDESGHGTMTSTFTSCNGYQACAADGDSCSSLLSGTPGTDAQCTDVQSQHTMEFSWQIVPDPNAPLKFRMEHVECKFDGAECKDVLSGLQSSGDSSEKVKAEKAGAALTVAAQKVAVFQIADSLAKETGSSSPGR